MNNNKIPIIFNDCANDYPPQYKWSVDVVIEGVPYYNRQAKNPAFPYPDEFFNTKDKAVKWAEDNYDFILEDFEKSISEGDEVVISVTRWNKNDDEDNDDEEEDLLFI